MARNLELELRWAPVLSTIHLGLAVVGALAFAGILVVLDLIVDGFDPLTDTISQHANGMGAWWITLAFLVAGATLMAAGYPVRFVIKRRGAKNLLAATFAVGGLCVAALAFFPTDPPGLQSTTGTVHLVLAGLGIVLVMVGAISGAWAFVHEEGWPYRGFYSALVAGVILGAFAIVLVVAAVGARGHAVGGALGLTERAVVFAELAWTTQMVWRVRQVAIQDDRLIVDGDDLYLAGVAKRDAGPAPAAPAPTDAGTDPSAATG